VLGGVLLQFAPTLTAASATVASHAAMRERPVARSLLARSLARSLASFLHRTSFWSSFSNKPRRKLPLSSPHVSLRTSPRGARCMQASPSFALDEVDTKPLPVQRDHERVS
jgi:hypothetical protein